MFVSLSIFSPLCFTKESLKETENRFLRITNWINKNAVENTPCKAICITDDSFYQGYLASWKNKYLSVQGNIEFVFLDLDEDLDNQHLKLKGDDRNPKKQLQKHSIVWYERLEETVKAYLPDGYLDFLIIPDELEGAVDSYGAVYPRPDLDEFFEIAIDENEVLKLFNLSPDSRVSRSLLHLCLDICLQDYDISLELDAQNYLLDVAALGMYLHEVSVAGGKWSQDLPEMIDFLDILPIDHFMLGLYVDRDDILDEEDFRETALQIIIDHRKEKIATLLVDFLGGQVGAVYTLWQAMSELNDGLHDTRYSVIFDEVNHYDDHKLIEFGALLNLSSPEIKEIKVHNEDWIIVSVLKRMIKEIINTLGNDYVDLETFGLGLKEFPNPSKHNYSDIKIESKQKEKQGLFHRYVIDDSKISFTAGYLDNESESNVSRWKIENEYFLFRSPVPAAKQPQKQTSDYLMNYWLYPHDDSPTRYSTLIDLNTIYDFEDELHSMLSAGDVKITSK